MPPDPPKDGPLSVLQLFFPRAYTFKISRYAPDNTMILPLKVKCSFWVEDPTLKCV